MTNTMNKQSAILTEQDFRAAMAKQCGFPSLLQSSENKRRLQLKDRQPTDAEVLSALQYALNDWDERTEHENDLRHESLMADESEYGPVCNERMDGGGE